jgi:sensor c-di-GMP phosphodiesterase-like protein
MSRFWLSSRFWITLSTVIFAAAVGAGIGGLFGGAIGITDAQNRLIASARTAMRESDASSKESREILAAMNSTPLPVCSHDEIQWLRGLILNSEYLKEAGHIRDGKIQCSSTAGRLANPIAVSPPDIVQSDGTSVYKRMAGLSVGGVAVVGLRVGGSYVVFTPYEQNRRPGFFVVANEDRHNSPIPLAGLNGVDSRTFRHEGSGRIGNLLYATQCSARYLNCVTDSISISEVMRSNRLQLGGYLCIGGLLGLLLGLAYGHRRGLEWQLRRAVRHDRLSVLYQPIVHLASGRITGAEALLRWKDDSGAEVNPDAFVRIAEERGFASDLTRLVIRHVIRDFRRTFQSKPGFRVNINVTISDLAHAEFPQALRTILDRAGLFSYCLGIEITESASVGQPEIVEAIALLRRRGHRVYVDDFGTGYSSLSYLHSLSIDAIKIDRAFTHAIGTGAVTVSIIPQILAIAEALNLDVVVEGVETAEQVEYFHDRKQPLYLQGWYFGFPVPPEEFHRLLASAEKKVGAFATLGEAEASPLGVTTEERKSEEAS